MFLKERDVPIILQQIRALDGRVLATHPKKKWIEKDKIIREKGYRGEQTLDKNLKYLPVKDFYIINDLTLQANSFPFQMDSVITSQYSITIIENKDHNGELTFDHSNGQLIRKFKGIEEGFPDPITQVLLHKRQLQQFLRQHNFPHIPINTIVSISNYSSIIKSPNEDKKIVQDQVFRVESVPDRILTLTNNQPKKILIASELHRLNELLLQKNSPYQTDILQTYSMTERDIIKGVCCPNCFSIYMEKKLKSWHCENCNYYSKDAFKSAINDYFLLYGPNITNSQCREFLKIESFRTAYNLLKSLGLPYTGSNKGRVYHPLQK